MINNKLFKPENKTGVVQQRGEDPKHFFVSQSLYMWVRGVCQTFGRDKRSERDVRKPK